MRIIWETSDTCDIVCSVIAILFIIIALFIFARSGIIDIRERKKMKEYLQKKNEKIEFIKFRIQITQDLDELGLVQIWGLAAAENIKAELIAISSDYGPEYGNQIIKEIKHLISLKEEDLTTLKIL